MQFCSAHFFPVIMMMMMITTIQILQPQLKYLTIKDFKIPKFFKINGTSTSNFYVLILAIV